MGSLFVMMSRTLEITFLEPDEPAIETLLSREKGNRRPRRYDGLGPLPLEAVASSPRKRSKRSTRDPSGKAQRKSSGPGNGMRFGRLVSFQGPTAQKSELSLIGGSGRKELSRSSLATVSEVAQEEAPEGI